MPPGRKVSGKTNRMTRWTETKVNEAEISYKIAKSQDKNTTRGDRPFLPEEAWRARYSQVTHLLKKLKSTTDGAPFTAPIARKAGKRDELKIEQAAN